MCLDTCAPVLLGALDDKPSITESVLQLFSTHNVYKRYQSNFIYIDVISRKFHSVCILNQGVLLVVGCTTEKEMFHVRQTRTLQEIDTLNLCSITVHKKKQMTWLPWARSSIVWITSARCTWFTPRLGSCFRHLVSFLFVGCFCLLWPLLLMLALAIFTLFTFVWADFSANFNQFLVSRYGQVNPFYFRKITAILGNRWSVG